MEEEIDEERSPPYCHTRLQSTFAFVIFSYICCNMFCSRQGRLYFAGDMPKREGEFRRKLAKQPGSLPTLKQYAAARNGSPSKQFTTASEYNTHIIGSL